MLDKAANVDEALELLAQYDMHSSAGSCYHFQLQMHWATVRWQSILIMNLKLSEKKEITRLQRISCCQRRNLIWKWTGRYQILEQALGECAGIVRMSRRRMDLLEAASKDWHVSETTGRLNATQCPLYIIARTLQPVWLPGGSMTSLPMNSVLNSNLFFCGEQSLDCLSAVVFWKVFMEYNISGNFPGFQIIIQPLFIIRRRETASWPEGLGTVRTTWACRALF